MKQLSDRFGRFVRKARTPRGRAVVGLALALAAVTGVARHQAVAQVPIDASIGRFCIYQRGIQVAELYSDRTRGGPIYAEDWVLSDRFQALDPRGREFMEVKGCGDPYGSVQAFLDKVGFGPGHRYIHVVAEEMTEIPGRTLR